MKKSIFAVSVLALALVSTPTLADEITEEEVQECVMESIESFREANGQEAIIRFDFLEEWEQMCRDGEQYEQVQQETQTRRPVQQSEPGFDIRFADSGTTEIISRSDNLIIYDAVFNRGNCTMIKTGRDQIENMRFGNLQERTDMSAELGFGETETYGHLCPNNRLLEVTIHASTGSWVFTR